MKLQIITPEKIIFDGQAYGVQVPGLHGSMEVLENHAPMVAALSEGVMKILYDKDSTNVATYQLSGGIIEMTSGNQATIMAESVNGSDTTDVAQRKF